jgi:hypothetical protein
MDNSKRKKVTPIFLYDPTKLGPITTTSSNYDVLRKKEFVGTMLCDCLIQRSLSPDELPDNTIVPSTEFFKNEMGVQLEKLGKSDRSSKTSVSRTRTKFNYFSFNRHTIIASDCLSDHFVVVTVTFDPTTPTIFERVIGYESLNSIQMISSQSRVSTRSGIGIPTNSCGAQCLMQLQRFLNEFSFYDIEGMYTTLKQDPKIILQRATYISCPQQTNGYDCLLFGFAILLHIAHGIKVDETIFTQANITKLRASLYTNGIGYTTRPEEIPLKKLS